MQNAAGVGERNGHMYDDIFLAYRYDILKIKEKLKSIQ